MQAIAYHERREERKRRRCLPLEDPRLNMRYAQPAAHLGKLARKNGFVELEMRMEAVPNAVRLGAVFRKV